MKKAIVWMAENHVAANLLMIMILLAGALAVSSTKIEIFPEVSMDQIQVQVVYPGASPDEIEEAVCLKIEEQISGLDGVSTITSVSNEGMGVVTVELELGQDIQEVKDKVKTEVDRITTFPESAEKPVIKEVLRRNQVISIALIGNASEHEMKELSEHVKTEILQFPEITQVEISGVRNYEISINVSEDQLRAYGLTFDMISAAVRRGSLDLPGGSINTEGGEILIRTKGQAYKKADYENIIILSRPDGHVLRVKDVASVVDGFEDSDLSSYFDGKAAAMLDVFRVADQSPIDIANRVKQYTAEKQLSLPEGIRIEYWLDQSRILNDRIDLLVRNGRAGLILVVIVLALFLDLRLALWVSSGIVISFLGSFITMDFLNVSINMISLFAFIL
ncbi:MAG: efflux RND transporter permease subunit, partial [Calditrichaeota bacterium]|nr:efflux RND transporter permease subunit [Calditrichota bacterium]